MIQPTVGSVDVYSICIALEEIQVRCGPAFGTGTVHF